MVSPKSWCAGNPLALDATPSALFQYQRATDRLEFSHRRIDFDRRDWFRRGKRMARGQFGQSGFACGNSIFPRAPITNSCRKPVEQSLARSDGKRLSAKVGPQLRMM